MFSGGISGIISLKKSVIKLKDDTFFCDFFSWNFNCSFYLIMA